MNAGRTVGYHVQEKCDSWLSTTNRSKIATKSPQFPKRSRVKAKTSFVKQQAFRSLELYTTDNSVGVRASVQTTITRYLNNQVADIQTSTTSEDVGFQCGEVKTPEICTPQSPSSPSNLQKRSNSKKSFQSLHSLETWQDENKAEGLCVKRAITCTEGSPTSVIDSSPNESVEEHMSECSLSHHSSDEDIEGELVEEDSQEICFQSSSNSDDGDSDKEMCDQYCQNEGISLHSKDTFKHELEESSLVRKCISSAKRTRKTLSCHGPVRRVRSVFTGRPANVTKDKDENTSNFFDITTQDLQADVFKIKNTKFENARKNMVYDDTDFDFSSQDIIRRRTASHRRKRFHEELEITTQDLNYCDERKKTTQKKKRTL